MGDYLAHPQGRRQKSAVLDGRNKINMALSPWEG